MTTQSGLYKRNATNENFNVPFIVEGVVVAIHYPDEASNKSKTEIEYDVDVTSVTNLGRVKNASRLETANGVDDGDDTVLRVAGAAVKNGRWVAESAPRTPRTPRFQSTGDRVLVAFVNGNTHRPVIVGVLPHKHSRRGFKDLAGKNLPKQGKLVRRTRHRGTEMVIDDEGNVQVIFGKKPDAQGNDTDDKKKLSIKLGDFTVIVDNTSSPTRVSFELEGSKKVLTFTKDALQIGNASTVAQLLGPKVTDFLKELTDKLIAHTHIGNLGAPTPLNPADIAQFTTLGVRAAAPTASNEMHSKWATVSETKP
jgi:hypothetical protein